MDSTKKLDMTDGSILKLVFLFALPICIGNILQQLYNTVDTLIVGNFCDSISLAAVGTSAQPVEILLCIFLGLGNGISILISQCVGSKDNKKLKEVVATAISFLYMCAIPVSILGFFFGPFVLKLMKVPEDTVALATQYVQIILLGTLGNMGYNMNAGILRGLGDSRSSLIFLMISCAVNIVLDLIFVICFEMNVSGVALATIIAMFCSWIFSILYIRKKYPYLSFTLLPKHFNSGVLKEIVSIGLPLGLNNALYSVGHIAMQTLINAQGSAFMAACSVATKVTGLANIAITSLSSAATTFAGQNLGAKKYTRLKKGALTIPLSSGFITCVAGLIFTAICHPILDLFTNDTEVLQLAVHYIRIVLPFTWMYAVFNGIICFANGIGEVRFPTVVNILMLWAVRIPIAYLIVHCFNGIYVIASIPISFAFGMIAMLCFFLTKRWRQVQSLIP